MVKFQKRVSLLLALLTVFLLSACGTQGGEKVNTTGTAPIVGSTADTAEAVSSEKKVLVAYFSATGTTEAVAGYLREAVGGTLYEITPADEYTAADLDYSDLNSRTTREQNDKDARPAIAGSVENMADYDVIFIGYPIWFGQAPRIINTFLESYDWRGKTIIPFCTSGGSDIGESGTSLRGLAAGAVWKEGKRFAGNTDKEAVAEWADACLS